MMRSMKIHLPLRAQHALSARANAYISNGVQSNEALYDKSITQTVTACFGREIERDTLTY